MAFCTGLIVANIYYCQPLGILMAKEFHLTESYAGNPRKNIMIGFILQIISLALLYFTGSHLYLFIAGIVLIDIGQQAIHVSNQTRIYTLIPEARNRLNTIFMSVSFIGASCGSALGLWLWDLGGWALFCGGCTLVTLLNMCIYLFYGRKKFIQS